MNIEKRTLGKTGLEISVLGYGCGGVWGTPLVSEKDAISFVHAAVDLGVNFFDTGSSYCKGNAEIRLGKALKNLNRDKLIIGTKAGSQIAENGKLYKDFSKTAIMKNIDQSLKKLGTDYVDLLQYHSPFLSDLNDEMWEILVNIKKSGKARFVGVSSDGEVLKRSLDTNVLDVFMTTFNVVNRENKETIERAHTLGVGVLIKSPMAHSTYNSELFRISSLRKLWYLLRVIKNYRTTYIRARKLNFMNTIEGVSPHNIALQYVLSQPGVSCAVMGTTNMNHLKSNVQGMANKVPTEIINKLNTITI